MYLLYVDESGDTGLKPGASDLFVLSGMVLHGLVWHGTLEAIIEFRRELRQNYGLKLREEIHCIDFIHKPGELRRIEKWKRLLILRDAIDFVESLSGVSLIHVLVEKSEKSPPYNVFENAWRALLQRFHNTIRNRNFPGPHNADDCGIVIADRTDEPKLRLLARRLRRYNPVPGRDGMATRMLPLRTLVEDAVHRDSTHSYFLQLVDVCDYFLNQREGRKGSKYVRKQGARNYFGRLNKVLCKVAATSDPEGIVRL